MLQALLLGLIAFCPILLGCIVWGITCIFNKDATTDDVI